MHYLIYIILIIISFELSLIFLVQYLRKEFQWLITKKDECPRLDANGLEKFLKSSHDPFLGWTRKPNTCGIEKGEQGQVRFIIDELGSRRLPGMGGIAPEIVCFGDSYTFCRQVEDNETWQCYLSNKLNKKVLNFGVGNYGVDQALLRYERTELPASVKVAILGFVPETICRIHSFWKHYLEFGNTFAFKPRFSVKNGGLKFHPNIMQTREDFSSVEEKLSSIQKQDYFYLNKFKKSQFRFPYTLSFMRQPIKNGLILSGLLRRNIYKLFANEIPPGVENYPFGIIMRNNIMESHRMYSTRHATELFKSILLRFKEKALERNHIPIILIMPQLIDLKSNNKRYGACLEFFEKIGRNMKVINITSELTPQNADEYYIEDLYGGHFSPRGNMMVAGALNRELNGLCD